MESNNIIALKPIKAKFISKKRKNKFNKIKLIKQIKNYCFALIISLIIIILLFSIYGLRKNYISHYKIIEVDIGPGMHEGGGPVQLMKGIIKVLPYKSKGCLFIPSESITLINGKNKSDYFYKSYPYFTESTLKEWKSINRSHSLLLGPNMVPIFWLFFPIQTSWKEKNFREILNNIKGYVVHSNRVRDYLATRSNTTDILKKYKIMRACTYILPKDINPFENRTIDILFYEKYPDMDRREQGNKIMELLNNTGKKIIRLKYGNYTKNQMFELSNNSKFIIYFSFFDTGAIGLKEIQNFGLFAFTLQEDLAIHKKTSLFIPELMNTTNMEPAFKKIMDKINIISKSHPNTKLIAKINQGITRCERALDDLCKSIL